MILHPEQTHDRTEPLLVVMMQFLFFFFDDAISTGITMMDINHKNHKYCV